MSEHVRSSGAPGTFQRDKNGSSLYSFTKACKKKGRCRWSRRWARQLQVESSQPRSVVAKKQARGAPESFQQQGPAGAHCEQHREETPHTWWRQKMWTRETFYAALCICWLQKERRPMRQQNILLHKSAWLVVCALIQLHRPIAIIQSPRDPINIISVCSIGQPDKQERKIAHTPRTCRRCHHCRRRLLSSEPEPSAIATVVSERLEPGGGGGGAQFEPRPAEDPAEILLVDRAPDR